MKQPYYTFAIIFLSLSIACGVIQGIIQFSVGNGMYFLQTFAHWYLVGNIISVIASLFVLNYLRLRSYKTAFYTGAIATVLIMVHVAFNYILLIYVLRELRGFGFLLVICYLIASLAFAATLIFSRAGERVWLKIAGIFMMGCYSILFAAIVAGLLSPQFFTTEMFTQIERWISLAGNLLPVMFIMNFVSELKSDNTDEPAVGRQSMFTNALAALTMVLTILALTLGSQVVRESHWNVDWQKNAPAKNKELAKDFESRMFVDGRGDTLYYLFKKPFDYDSLKKYPVVVCLHGGPVRERKIEVAAPAPLLSEPENQRKYPAFLLVPQAPPGHTWGGVPGLPSVDSMVFEVMALLENEFSIDPTRRYVAGASMGGFGAWHFIGSRPEIFAAAMPFCGAGNTALAEKMIETAIWAFHGDVDRNVSVRASRQMIEAIRQAGGTPRYTEFPGTGHNVWPEISATPGLLDWLFAQQRSGFCQRPKY